jgi:hypothetical protein
MRTEPEGTDLTVSQQTGEERKRSESVSQELKIEEWDTEDSVARDEEEERMLAWVKNQLKEKLRAEADKLKAE